MMEHLPEEIKHTILLFTGKFKLRYDNKLKKQILASRLDFPRLQTFYNELQSCINKKRFLNRRVYATNYNVLRIMAGMAPLAYSN